MASRKEYTYQIKGNKLSLLEKDFSTTDGLNYTFSGTAGDGITDDIPSGTTTYKSPLTAITDGIEIEYAYSPTYTLPEIQFETNAFKINAWIVVDGYLTFVRSGKGNTADWASTSPYNSIAVDEHIYISGTERWDGIHKVQEVQNCGAVTHGGIKTYTKVNQSTAYFYNASTGWGNVADTLITPVSGGQLLHDTFNHILGKPIYLSGSDAADSNNGVYENWEFNSTTDESITGISIANANRYYRDNNYINEVDDATVTFTSDSTQPVYIYEAFRIPEAYVVSDVNVLNDESDTIDLPPYLAKALVYYVKAKVAEDQMNIEVKEYMMREFRKMIEKHESSKIAGPRMMMPGNNALR